MLLKNYSWIWTCNFPFTGRMFLSLATWRRLHHNVSGDCWIWNSFKLSFYLIRMKLWVLIDARTYHRLYRSKSRSIIGSLTYFSWPKFKCFQHIIKKSSYPIIHIMMPLLSPVMCWKHWNLWQDKSKAKYKFTYLLWEIL